MFGLVWLVSSAAAVAQPALPESVLETGRCSPAAQVRQALTDAGQFPIIIGNRTGYGFPTSLIFFANAEGSRGFLVRGDKALGEQAETICIDSAYRDVKLNSIANPDIPGWAKLGGDAVQINAICKRDRLGYQEQCQPHDVSVETLYRNGQRVMFMALGTAINPRDHTIRANQRIWLSLNASGGGLVNATTPEGADYILSAYTKGALTQHGSALLK